MNNGLRNRGPGLVPGARLPPSDSPEGVVEAIAGLVRHFLETSKPPPDAGAVEPWVTVADGAHYASVSEDTLREWITSGALKVGRVGRLIRVRRSEIDRLLLADESQNAEPGDADEAQSEEGGCDPSEGEHLGGTSCEESDAETTSKARAILASLKGGSRG